MSGLVDRLKERANVLEAASAWGSQDGHFMASAASRIERLESALREIADGGPDRKVAVPYFPDKPSKYDKCEHGLAMWEDCGECTAGFARSALSQEETR